MAQIPPGLLIAALAGILAWDRMIGSNSNDVDSLRADIAAVEKLANSNKARLDSRGDFMGCAIREIDRLDSQHRMDQMLPPRCDLRAMR